MKTKLFLLAAVSVAAFALVVSTASAHSRPVRFDPAPGAVLAAPPAKVQGWFTSEIRRDPNWAFVQVTDAQGSRVDAGDTSLGSDRKSLSVALKPNLSSGTYTVTWRTFDDEDGAVFGDCYTFFVGQTAADAAVTANSRLDAGEKCQRIDFEAKGATPTAAQAAPKAEDAEEHDHGGGGGGIPAWALVLGIVGGVVAGGAGGKFIGQSHTP